MRLNSFKIVAISLPSHRNCIDNCTTHIRTEAKIIILHETKLKLFTQKYHFGYEVKMMPIEHIQEVRAVGTWNVSFCAQFACRLTKWPKWPDQVPSNGPVIFYDAGFLESSEAVDLSQVSEMLRQLTGQISAHYSSCKIKN